MTFQLGRNSIRELSLVHPRMVALVKRAIEITEQDFTVYDGARSIEEQREFVRRGVSKTMNSKHLVRADGFGVAVDLVPWVAGRPQWIWSTAGSKTEGGAFAIAVAMHQAAREQSAGEVTWGAVWDKRLLDLPADYAGLKAAVTAYTVRHPGPDFLDGPHFQLGA